MFLTRFHLSRRTVLRGMGATIALPFLDAMAPAGASAQNGKPPVRLIAMEMVHGAAGSTARSNETCWAPAPAANAATHSEIPIHRPSRRPSRMGASGGGS